MKTFFLLFFVAFCGMQLCAQHLPEEQAARQARSVHLVHRTRQAESKVYYIEGTVDEVHPGTYICFIAFHAGYCGLQELANGEHKAIFSIWEPNEPFDFSANPNVVKEASRTRPLYGGEGVDVSRFGGEGTGGKSMMTLNWKKGEKVRMAISCGKDGDIRTTYTCWIYINDAWFRMATFSSLVGEGKVALRDPYSFVEDFLRNVESRNYVRKVYFSRLWNYTDEEGWDSSRIAGFSADSNLLMNIDAGPSPSGYWLATGGDIENKTVPLGAKMLPGRFYVDDSLSYREALIEAIKAADAMPSLEAQP